MKDLNDCTSDVTSPSLPSVAGTSGQDIEEALKEIKAMQTLLDEANAEVQSLRAQGNIADIGNVILFLYKGMSSLKTYCARWTAPSMLDNDIGYCPTHQGQRTAVAVLKEGSQAGASQREVPSV